MSTADQTVDDKKLIEHDYICINCGHAKKMKYTQPITCDYCHHSRIFRKVRTPNIVQFIAR